MNVTENKREFLFTRDDFNYLRTQSNEHSGILVPDDKFDMFYSRLSKRVRKLGLANFKEYCHYLKNHPEEEFTEFINAVTTNLTAFFREKHHFDYLENTLIPELLIKNGNTKSIRIWCSASSTGEEPYSLAMTILENVPKGWEIKILATDLDTNVLQTAADGIYANDRVVGLPTETLKRWFKRGSGKNANQVKVNTELQKILHFKQLNLMNEWHFKHQFDFIFCRNVLIYFDRDTKECLAQRFGALLNSGSHLFIGHSESLNQLDTCFDLLGNTIYKKTNGA